MTFTSSNLLEHLSHNGIPRDWFSLEDRGSGRFVVLCDHDHATHLSRALQHHDDLSFDLGWTIHHKDGYKASFSITHNHTN